MNDTDIAMTNGAEAPAQSTTEALPVEPGSTLAETMRESPVERDDRERPISTRQRTVPYGALAEERARRKELQRELQSAIEAQQKLQGRLDFLHELAQQRGASAADDATGSSSTNLNDTRDLGAQATPDTTGAVAQAESAFRTDVMRSVREVMQERPDFLAAYQHARQARVSELSALGFAPREALQITFENELEIIQNAYANGRNPADVIYDYARRHGYGGAGPSPSPHVNASRPKSHAMTEAEKVALAARGQAGSKSLSTVGGGSTGALTLEALAGMSDEEFAEATKGDRWQRLLGG